MRDSVPEFYDSPLLRGGRQWEVKGGRLVDVEVHSRQCSRVGGGKRDGLRGVHNRTTERFVLTSERGGTAHTRSAHDPRSAVPPTTRPEQGCAPHASFPEARARRASFRIRGDGGEVNGAAPRSTATEDTAHVHTHARTSRIQGDEKSQRRPAKDARAQSNPKSPSALLSQNGSFTITFSRASLPARTVGGCAYEPEKYQKAQARNRPRRSPRCEQRQQPP
jgi:hypothetical protein